MAQRARPLSRSAWSPLPARLALGGIALLVGGALAGLGAQALLQPSGLKGLMTPYLWSVFRFTILQAALSTAISLALALPLARALSRHPDFPGRTAILNLFTVPLIIPALVAAVGLLTLYGRSGWFADPLSTLIDGHWPGIYGLGGILMAHVFFNLPLAARFLLGALDTIPDDSWRLARHLGLNGWSRFRVIEAPVLAEALAPVALLVFTLCLTSFTLVLVLGGGPRATTLEVAIYQALRFDFLPDRVLVLALVQMGIGLAFAWLASRFGTPAPDIRARIARSIRPEAGRFERVANLVVIALAALFVALPVAALIVRGLQADLVRLLVDPAVARAVMTSILLALCSAMLALAFALALLTGTATSVIAGRLVRHGAGLLLVVSPVMIGAGWFILLRPLVDPFAAAPLMVLCVNAVMALPFMLAVLAPAWRDSAARHDRLAQSLGLVGWTRFRLIEARLLAAPLALAFSFGMALSMGDLGAVALWGSNDLQTLPWLLNARLGSYRTDDAAGLALILLFLCLLVLLAGNRIGRTANRSNAHG